MKLIVINDGLKTGHKEMIRETAAKAGCSVWFFDSEKEVLPEHYDADIIYGFGMNIAATSTSLKWLCVPSAGVDFLMKQDAFANKDCLLTNSSGSYGVSIAEHIIAVSIMMMRKLTDSYQESLRGEWGPHKNQRSLKGSRITVLGAGDIGSTFARRAKSFEPKSLIGLNRSGKSTEAAFDRIEKTDQLDNILPETDLLVVCLPSTPETKGILSRKRLSLLPGDAYIVNVGRGSAIDEDSLADMLDAGELGGAALDVFITEPLPKDSRLWKTKNLLITPHISGNLTLPYTVDKNVEMFCEDLLNFSEGRPLKHLVDRNRGY